MPRPTLKKLGIDKSAVPLFEELLGVNDTLRQIHAVRETVPPAPAIVSRSFVAAPGRKAVPPTDRKAAAKPKSAISQFHEVRRLLDERAFYPPHSARKETSAYAKIHKQLVAKHGCLICGVTNDVLKDKNKKIDLRLNPYAAKQLETHHHVIEWALANAVDTDKFNKHLFPHLKARHPARYPQPLTAQQIKDWVDHSEDNLWVLCDVHHRAKYFGIHEITDPLWGPQDLFDDGYLAKVREAIGKNGKSGKNGKAAAGKKTNGNHKVKSMAASAGR